MGVLPDVLQAGLDIVFCGTAVGAASARRGAYYAGPGNKFWPTLHAVDLTPRQLRPEEYRTILEYGLGLTDLAKGISGADRVLSSRHFDVESLKRKLLRYVPRILAFTGKRAAHEFFERRRPIEYGPLEERVGETMLFVLPSPSGAARGYWDPERWKELQLLSRALAAATLRKR